MLKSKLVAVGITLLIGLALYLVMTWVGSC